MYHERALGLLSSKERELIKGFFDADGGQITSITSLASGPARTAYAHYGLVKESLFKHIKNRKTDNDKIPISVPLFIWLQPSLSFMEKHLLADVWDLQQKPLGCFKSNSAMAIEVGTTAENVKDMICRLKKAGFLASEPKAGKRYLTLAPAYLQLAGKLPLTDPSVPTDAEVSAHLPSGQSPLTAASVPTDEEQERDLDETPVDIDDSADHDAPRLQGDISFNQQQPQAEAAARGVVVDDSKPKGAAAPCDPCRGASPPATPNAPAGKGRTRKQSQGASQSIKKQPSNCADQSEPPRLEQPAYAPPAQADEAGIDSPASQGGAGAPVASANAADPALATSAPAREAQRLLQVFSREYPRFFQKGYQIEPQDLTTATQYFQEHPERTALEVANYLLRAWKLSFQRDGTFVFACCKRAKHVAGFFKWLERDDGKDGIVENVDSHYEPYWNCEEEGLLRALREVCRNENTLSEVFSDEVRRGVQRKHDDAEADAERLAKAEQQRQQAEQQAEEARKARTQNPTAKDIQSAIDELSMLYSAALASDGVRASRCPTQRQLDFMCEVLDFQASALREWSEHHGNHRLPRTSNNEVMPDDLRSRLEAERMQLRKHRELAFRSDARSVPNPDKHSADANLQARSGTGPYGAQFTE